MAVEAASLVELSNVANSLSVVIQYGSIRQLDPKPLIPILQQIFYRSCLILPTECSCDDEASKAIAPAIDRLNSIALGDFRHAAVKCVLDNFCDAGHIGRLLHALLHTEGS